MQQMKLRRVCSYYFHVLISMYLHVKLNSVNFGNAGYIEPIPALIQSVIDHLSQWYLIREQEKPNSCIINFFDEVCSTSLHFFFDRTALLRKSMTKFISGWMQGEHSQPFLKPPHLDQPLSTLLLSESTMAFGRTLACDKEGNYKGPLVLSLKEGYVLYRV